MAVPAGGGSAGGAAGPGAARRAPHTGPARPALFLLLVLLPVQGQAGQAAASAATGLRLRLLLLGARPRFQPSAAHHQAQETEEERAQTAARQSAPAAVSSRGGTAASRGGSRGRVSVGVLDLSGRLGGVVVHLLLLRPVQRHVGFHSSPGVVVSFVVGRLFGNRHVGQRPQGFRDQIHPSSS